MSPNDIRLRLTVRRHGLPELKLVWPCTVSDDLTIAGLLTEINKVVTLENGDWGLEDYAVELADAQGGSFECLHFQQVGKVFKHDDQVLIRSLLTEDIRRRRISGRHQISNGGIHLVDGIPFGRNRGPRDRPVLALPPRKRARITYGQGEDDEDEEGDDEESRSAGQMLLGGGHLPAIMDAPAATLDTSDDDDDQDFVSADPGSDSDEDMHHNAEADDDSSVDADGHLNDEVRLLQADNDIIGDDEDDDFYSLHLKNATNQPPEKVESQLLLNGRAKQKPFQPPKKVDAQPQPLLNGIAPTAIECLQSAFPETPSQTIEAELQLNNTDIQRTYNKLSETYDAILSFDEVLDKFLAARFQSQAEPPALLPEAPKAAAKPLIQEVDSDDEAPPPVALTKAKGSEDDSDEGSSDYESESSSEASSDDGSDDDQNEDDSSDGDSDSDDSSDSGAADVSNEAGAQEPPSGANSPEDSDDADNDSDASEEWEGLSTPGRTQQCAGKDAKSDDASSDSSSSSDDSSSSDSDSDSAPEDVSSKIKVALQLPSLRPSHGVESPERSTVGRGQGLSKTQKRNARRKLAKKMRGVEDAQPQQQAQGPSIQDDLDARRQALLNAIADEPEETPPRPRRPLIQEVEMEEAEPASPDVQSQPNGDTPVPAEPSAIEQPSQEPDSTTSSKDDSGRRRMRVDMGAGRRLLFGALGLKNPKSKSDEDQLKEGLMKDVRPLKNHRLDEPAEAEKVPEAEPIDDDSWREKITYRAVECCHDDMVLSEPPFPFVQRWDPQQHYGAMKKRKRNSQNYTQEDYYYEDESYWYGEGDEEEVDPRQSKKSKKAKKKAANKAQETEDPAPEVELDYDDNPAKDQTMDSQATDMDDLPSLPTDVSALPTIQLDDVRPGMVITWKEFRLSKATNWQPESISVTGMMISKEVDKVHLILAKRDREHNDKLYDEETGERIYDKFEVPDNSEDEEDDEDDGHRDLSWIEMMDPRLIQEEPSSSLLNSPITKGFQPGSAAAEGGLDTGSPPMESSITDGNPMQIPEGIDTEFDLSTGDNHEVQDSPSIPSGQNYPHLYPTAPSIGGPSNSDASKADTSQGVFGPTEDVIKDSQPAARHEGLVSNTETEPQDNGSAGQDSDDEVIDGTGSGGAHHAPPANVMSASPEAEDKEPTPAVEYPHLHVPSSIASVDSGRQPEDNAMTHGAELPKLTGMEASNNTDIRATPRRGGGGLLEDADSHKSSSPFFPSFDEMYYTAQTSKKTRSPLKASQTSVLGERKKNVKSEYEEAMRKLDQGEDSDVSPNKNKSIRSLFPNATQPARLEAEDSPAPLGKTPNGRKKKNKSSPFLVPAGSQVIALSSDGESSLSPSPAPVENYAEDDIDETYEHGGSPLPQGRGCVKKTRGSSGGATETDTRSRGKSMPAAVSDGSIKKNMIPVSSAGAGAGRRRMSKKF